MTEYEKIQKISEIIYDHLKGKHKDLLSKKLAVQIVEALQDNPPTWYIHG
jgi:hypothetical protein